ncbi:His-Xaa-Ser system radical SAM maturase HxsB [Candidatus Woesearchaeota archaeon]|nr:His-Xaa-Ser system radical SAM maturase HxsB [Candidatus Woesearchaeota archaeon]
MDYILNYFLFKKFGEKYLLTNDSGSWIFLDDSEFTQLRSGTIDQSSSLFSDLEKYGFILLNRNFNSVKNLYLNKFQSLFNPTSLHIIVPTLRCNFKCVYCHSSVRRVDDSSDFDMNDEVYKSTVDFIFQSPSKTLTIEFQGGDSMLNKKLFKNIVLYSEAKNREIKKEIRFCLVTNLTLLDRDIVEFIDEHKISINSSLDGFKELHDNNRCFDGHFNGLNMLNNVKYDSTYDSVLATSEILKKEYGLTANYLMVTTRKSLSKPREIIDEYLRMGQNSIQLKYINKLGFAEKTWGEIGYTIDEFLEFWKKSVDYIIELNKSGIYFEERYIKLVLFKILSGRDPGFLDFRSPCGIVFGQLAYNYNGDIYSCDEGRAFEEFKLGNVKTHTYNDIVTSEKAINLSNSSILDNYACSACVYKPYCGTCPVINYAEDGNIIPKLSKNSKCKFFKYVFDYVFDKLLNDTEISNIFMNWMRQR